MHGSDGSVNRELDRADEVGRSCLEHGTHEVFLRQRAVLQHFDRAERLGHELEHARHGGLIAHVGHKTPSVDSLTHEPRGEGIDAFLIAGNQSHRKALLAETTCDGSAES